ncbi:MAG: hypothetical protein CM15mP1_2980 [Methanobacteriota archaeon]|nr:MAG: hypothetical protein CM15mP1_2980 [Euryarchaeota archaeon]
MFREHVGPDAKIYSWWSNRGQARQDRGWRIDYILGNKAAKEMTKIVEIDRQGGIEVSDPAPVILDLHSS